jgi:hypothetical protein
MSSVKPNKAPKICRVWTKEEIQFLRENYKSRGGDYVAMALERSLNSVRIQAFYLNQTKAHEPMGSAARSYADTRRNGKVTGGEVRVVVSAPADQTPPPAVIEHPAIREPSFIRPLSKAQLMAGR